MTTQFASTPVVLGCCLDRGQKVVVHAGSPELLALLSTVTPEGPRSSRYRQIRGVALLALLDKQQDLLIRALTDRALMDLCTKGGFLRASVARKEVARRIHAGNETLFCKLLAITQPYCQHKELRALRHAVLAPAMRSLAGVNGKALQPYTNSKDPIKAFAAQSKWEEESRRVTQIRNERGILRGLPTLSLSELMELHNSGPLCTPALRDGLQNRLRKESLGQREIAGLLPFRGLRAIKEFLGSLGVPALGNVARPRDLAGDRWDRNAVVAAIEFHPAYLFKRSQKEFRGRLPDDLHARMLLGSGKYVQRYVRWIEKVAAGNQA